MSTFTSSNDANTFLMREFHEACECALTATSGMDAYERLMNLVLRNVGLAALVPDSLCRVLILDRKAGGRCTMGKCQARHVLHWHSNFEFLQCFSKLHLTTELRILLPEASPLPLKLSSVMEKFGITKVQSLKISSIVILGQGLLAASANSLQSSREVEADQAARSIIGICPRMTSLLYNPDEFWPSEVELPLFEPEIEPHTGILPCMGAILISNLLTHSVSSLTAAHALFAFPDNAGAAFSENLTRIDINARLVRSLRRFPKIPVAKLRKVGIYNIDNLVDWELFQSNGDVLEFPRVEDLALGFADRVHGRSTVTSSVHDILFPAIRMLKVSGLAHSMMNFPAHFPPGSVTLLTLLDEPDVFLKAGYNILSCTQNLFVRSLETESTASGIELATALQRLFRQRLRLRNVAFEGVAYTLPKVINWVWLKWFQFTTHILSVKDIVKLLVQLPRLKTLVLKCQTMPLDDMGADASFDPNGANPVHASLQRFDIETQQYLDMTEIIELVSCLPAISEVGVSRDLVAAMDSCIKALLSKSHVLVREFSQV